MTATLPRLTTSSMNRRALALFASVVMTCPPLGCSPYRAFGLLRSGPERKRVIHRPRCDGTARHVIRTRQLALGHASPGQEAPLSRALGLTGRGECRDQPR